MTTDPEHPNFYFECERWWKEQVGILYELQYSYANWQEFTWRDLVIAYHHYRLANTFYETHGVESAVDVPDETWNVHEQCEFIISKWIAYQHQSQQH